MICFYAILDPESGTLRYANAGHGLPHLRQEVSKVEDPMALFETMAEVLGGLITAHEHYEPGAEEAFRD